MGGGAAAAASVPPWAVWGCLVAISVVCYVLQRAWGALRRRRARFAETERKGAELQAIEVRRAMALERMQAGYSGDAADAARRATARRAEAAGKEVERLARTLAPKSGDVGDQVHRPAYNPLTGQGAGNHTRPGGFGGACSKYA